MQAPINQELRENKQDSVDSCSTNLVYSRLGLHILQAWISALPFPPYSPLRTMFKLPQSLCSGRGWDLSVLSCKQRDVSLHCTCHLSCQGLAVSRHAPSRTSASSQANMLSLGKTRFGGSIETVSLANVAVRLPPMLGPIYQEPCFGVERTSVRVSQHLLTFEAWTGRPARLLK